MTLLVVSILSMDCRTRTAFNCNTYCLSLLCSSLSLSLCLCLRLSLSLSVCLSLSLSLSLTHTHTHTQTHRVGGSVRSQCSSLKGVHQVRSSHVVYDNAQTLRGQEPDHDTHTQTLLIIVATLSSLSLIIIAFGCPHQPSSSSSSL